MSRLAPRTARKKNRAVQGAGRSSPAELYERLLAAQGYRHWWPAKTAFEICLGAILTQNVAWRNVEQAIANLRAANALGPRKILALDEAELGELIRPSGYFRVKAKRVRAFLEHVRSHHRMSIKRLLALPQERLRDELLGISGIGRETADCIVCYAAGYPVFVVDAYTRRLAYRLGWFPNEKTEYETLRAYVETRLPGWSAERLGDFHAQIVYLASRVCVKRDPHCAQCPLRQRCPQGQRKEEPA